MNTKVLRIGIKRAAVLLVPILFSACHDLNNPVDPEAVDYQGFQTVADASEVGPDNPVDGGTSNYQVFMASEVLGGDSSTLYHFIITDEFDTYLDNDAISGNIYAADLGLEEGSYVWEAQITGELGRGDEAQFTAASVTANVPADDGSTEDTSPTITWNEFTDADSYEFQMAVNSDNFSGSTVEPVSDAGTGYSISSDQGLTFGDTVYWRARPVAEHQELGTVYGYWSIAKSFDISWDYSFSGIEPESGSTVNGSSVTLNWDDIEGASSYQVQYAADSYTLEYGSPTDTTTTFSSKYLSGLSEGTYYWRVRPINSDGMPGQDWGGPYSFTFSSSILNESFESYSSGDVLNDNGWSTPTGILDDGWYVVTYDEYYDGSRSLRSDDISDNQEAYVEYTFDTDGMVTVSFWYMVDSESCCDELHFYVNNSEVAELTDTDGDWEFYEHTVYSGDYTLKWSYEKDGSVSNGEDCVWIDLVVVE